MVFPEDDTFLWIAEEGLGAELPGAWGMRKDPEGLPLEPAGGELLCERAGARLVAGAWCTLVSSERSFLRYSGRSAHHAPCRGSEDRLSGRPTQL